MIRRKDTDVSAAPQEGFTLIEIVLVLLILGILSAIAVPRYFDLTVEAERKASLTALEEAQARIHARFAQALLDGDTCAVATGKVNRISLIADEMKNGAGRFKGFLVTTPGSETITSEGVPATVTVEASGRAYGNLGTLFVPACGNDSTDPDSPDVPVDPDPEPTPSGGATITGGVDWNVPDDRDCTYGCMFEYSTVFRVGDDYYVLATSQPISSAELDGPITESGVWKNGHLIPLDVDASRIVTPSSQNGNPYWEPALKRGDITRGTDGNWYIQRSDNVNWEAVPPGGNWIRIGATIHFGNED